VIEPVFIGRLVKMPLHNSKPSTLRQYQGKFLDIQTFDFCLLDFRLLDFRLSDFRL
jgi:hypothetical protein